MLRTASADIQDVQGPDDYSDSKGQKRMSSERSDKGLGNESNSFEN